MILTDPPYPNKYLHLWDEMTEVATRVLKPGGYLVTYSGQFYLPYVMNALGKHLTYCWTICLQHTGRKQMVFARRVICSFKPILVFRKGPAGKFKKTIVDFITNDRRDKKHHKWGQGEKAVEFLMENFSEPNDLVLDPFAGGGTTLAVAGRLSRNCIGVEIDSKLMDVIRDRLSAQRINDNGSVRTIQFREFTRNKLPNSRFNKHIPFGQCI